MSLDTRAPAAPARIPSRLDSPVLVRAALALLLLIGAGVLFYETRNTTFWSDEWGWAFFRRESGLDSFLEPHNQHLTLIPVAVYKLLFATAGLDNYAAFRVVLIVAHLACVTLLFEYTRRRVGSALALLASASIVLFGPAWQVVLWPFQIGWLISIAAGVGTLMLIERGDRIGDLGACALLGVSLASSGLGAPVAAGVLLEVLWDRRRWRRIWIVLAPLALYGIWLLAYQDSELFRHNIVLAPGWVADAFSAAMASLFGLGGQTALNSVGKVDVWGPPLAIAALVLAGWRIARLGELPARVLSLGVILLAFWTLTAVGRSHISPPSTSRYLYVSCFLLLLLAAELGRGTTRTRWFNLVLSLVVAAAMLSNFGILRDAGRFLRGQAMISKANLGALELGRDVAREDYIATRFPGFPFVVIPAGAYYRTADAIGSPALAPAEIPAAPEEARSVADAELIRLYGVRLRPDTGQPVFGTRPAVESSVAGNVSVRGACVRFQRSSVVQGEKSSHVDLELPRGGLLVTARDGPVEVRVRRFAAAYPSAPIGEVTDGGSGILTIVPDSSPVVWHVRVSAQQAVRACGLA